jgi:hypothetical protein
MARQVDTSEVFKQPFHCFRCDEAFYFTLRAIAENQKLKCPVPDFIAEGLELCGALKAHFRDARLGHR